MAYKSNSHSQFHDDSDADDEFERSLMSPTLPVEYDEASTDSGPPSAEHTPTTFSHSRDSKGSPTGLITDWSSEQTADFISDLGLEQYADAFVGTWHHPW